MIAAMYLVKDRSVTRDEADDRLVDEGDAFSDREWDELIEALGLSGRQVQIARLILEGMSDKQIAAELRMSIATVRTHLSRLFAKLEVQNRNELILLVLRQFRTGCREADCQR